MPEHRRRQRKRRTKRISLGGLLAGATAMFLVSGFIGAVAYRRGRPIYEVILMSAGLWLTGMFAVWAIATNRREHRVKSEINPSVIRPPAESGAETESSE